MSSRCKELERLYRSYRSVLRLYPNMVPSPLWGITLAHLARCDPATLACALGMEEAEEPLRRLSNLWMRVPRRACSFCGRAASDLHEDWEFLPDYDRGEGEAILKGLAPICKRCHDVIHLGRATVTGRLEEAISWFKQVNADILRELGEDPMQLLDLAWSVWECRSKFVNRWKIRLRALEELSFPLTKEYVRILERLMNLLVDSESIYLDGSWLCVESSREPDTLTHELDPDSTMTQILEKARRLKGLRVCASRLMRALQLVNEVVRSKGKASLGGAWILVGERRQLARLFHRISGEIAEGVHPAYRGALYVRRNMSNGVLVLGTRNFLDVEDVVRVVMQLGFDGTVFQFRYRPDIFREYRLKEYAYKFAGTASLIGPTLA